MTENDGTKTSTWLETAKEKLTKDLEHYTFEYEMLKEAVTNEWNESIRKNDGTYPAPQNGWGLYEKILCAYGIIVAIICGYFILSASGLLPPLILNLGVPVNAWFVLTILLLAYTAAGIRLVSLDELAGIKFLGRALKIPNAGLWLILPGPMLLYKIGRQYRDDRYPSKDPNKIYRVSSDEQSKTPGGDSIPPDMLAQGYVRPFYLVSGSPDTKEKGAEEAIVEPLHNRMVIDVQWTIRYRPNEENGGIFRILRNLMSGNEPFDERAKDLTQENAEQVILEMVGSLTPAQITGNKDLFNRVLTMRLRVAFLRLGIYVDNAALLEVNASHKTHEAIAGVPRAEANRITTEINAEADRIRLAKEGQGRGEARHAELNGEAQGILALMKETGLSGEQILASETAQKALKDGDLVLGLDGVKELFGLFGTATKRLRRTD